jgi:hypothetical protein
MVNQLSGGGDGLQPVDYSHLLQQISQAIQGHHPFQFSRDGNRLRMDLDWIAAAVATTPGLQNPLTSANGVRSATIKFTAVNEDRFSRQIQQLRDQLQQKLQEAVGLDQAIADRINHLIHPLSDYQGSSNQVGLNFNFAASSPPLQKQKLRLETHRPGSESLLKFHKLTISVQKVDRFTADLKTALETYMETHLAADEKDSEELLDILQGLVTDELSDFYRLQKLVDTESLGKLKKEAKIFYLKYLEETLDSPESDGKIYLQDLIRRLQLIETYINNPNKSDADYDVNYAGITVNYKEAFSRAEVWDSLPIIPLIAGNLGEHTDKQGGNREFIFGLKLKLAGKIQNQDGLEVLEYNLNLLNPASEKHRQGISDPNQTPGFARTVLIRLLLYYFIFASPWNPEDPNYQPHQELTYQPDVRFEEKVMPILRGSDEQQKQTLFRGLVAGVNQSNVALKISRLKEFLKTGLKRQGILPTRIYPRQINLKKTILHRDINLAMQGYLLQPAVDSNLKEGLKYVTISDPGLDETALCQLKASFTLEDLRYFSEPEQEQLTWKYQIDGLSVLPIICTPTAEVCRKVYGENFQATQEKLILWSYDNTRLNSGGFDAIQTFAYRFTWTVLSYICLDLILEQASSNLFIPFVRFHQGSEDNPFPAEKFLANLCKVLSYLLSHRYRSNCQGFRVRNLGPQTRRYTLGNGLNSLYSVLPKTFTLGETTAPLQLDKLAIAIVSSRECDASTQNKNPRNRIANVTGEIISIQRQQSGTVQIERLHTFSDNYSLHRLYREPPILIDTVNQLYRQGYRHILYVAQAPYTSTLHITRGDRDEDLYFMSPTLITALIKNNPDLKIYPVFFDKYYVRKLREPRVTGFVIQDTQQLTTLTQDPRQQAVVFLNLFNGLSVVGNNADEKFYNGVISYSTLLGNFYQGVMDDQSIRQDLIYETPLKQDLVEYLTLFHFSRFERQNRQSLKLDPYETLIGDKSFSALSVFEQMTPRVDFNSLAFLTQVKKVLDLRHSE